MVYSIQPTDGKKSKGSVFTASQTQEHQMEACKYKGWLLTLQAQSSLMGTLTKYVNLGQKLDISEPALQSRGCQAAELRSTG